MGRFGHVSAEAGLINDEASVAALEAETKDVRNCRRLILRLFEQVLVLLQRFVIRADDLCGAIFTHPIPSHLVVLQPFLKLGQIERVAICRNEFAIVIRVFGFEGSWKNESAYGPIK